MSSRKRKNRSEPEPGTDKGRADASRELSDEAAAAIEHATAEELRDAGEAAISHSHITELKPRESAQADAADEADDEELDDDDEAAATAVRPPTNRAQLKRILESLIFVSDQIVSAQQLARLAKVKAAEVRELVAELSVDYEGRGIELVEVGGGFQFRSAASSAAFVRDLVAQRPTRLTRAQLETLALIAYRQPITRPEVDDVRGVDSGSAIKVLLDRELVKILGRKDEAGRPLLYGTTPFFLEFFGMNSMKDLPTLREFTELTAEHRELFQRKTGEVPDLSAEPGRTVEVDSPPDVDEEAALGALGDEPADADASEPQAASDAAESLAAQGEGEGVEADAAHLDTLDDAADGDETREAGDDSAQDPNDHQPLEDDRDSDAGEDADAARESESHADVDVESSG
jgi:segregation and condensation protein B